MPTELSPRDRGFTYPGVKQSVKVDHIELIDALGEQSKFPCNKSMNGVFDECAYRKVCVLKYKAVKHESNRENIDEGKSAFKVWLHCTMDAPTTYLPSRENKKYSEGCHFLVS